MKVSIDDGDLVIEPEDEQDAVWIKHELGMEKDGDTVELRRCDVSIGFGDNKRLHHLRARKVKE